MDFSVIPVFGQGVKPALGIRYSAHYWVFFDKRTELPPWLVLHRESINDTELAMLLDFGMPRSRTADHVDCKVLKHFGLVEGDLYEPSWTVTLNERRRNAVFTGALQVVKLPLAQGLESDLRNPNSIYWASQHALLHTAPGTAEHERNSALVEMANVLLSRWREHDLENLEFKSKSRLQELWAEAVAVGQGAGAGLMNALEGLWQLLKLTIEVSANAFKASCDAFVKVVNSNFEQMKHMLMQAGIGLYNSAAELCASIAEGMRMLQRIGSDPLLRVGLMEFLDGYTESVPHLRRIRNISGVVAVVGIEVALALATMGGSVAAGAARVGSQAARIGPFTRKALAHLANVARNMDKAQASKLRALPSASARAQGGRARTGPAPAATSREGQSSAARPTNSRAQSNHKSSTGASAQKVNNSTTAGEPISMFNGEELLQLHDCALPGTVDLAMQRTYRSSLAEQGFNTGLGVGWAHPLAQSIVAVGEQSHYLDGEGRTVYFEPLHIGQACTNHSEQLTLCRTGEHSYTLTHSSGLGVAIEFEGQALALHRMVDAFGNALVFKRNAQGLLEEVQSNQATWLLHYNAQGLLSSIVQVPNQGNANNPLLNHITLVQYQYNPAGQLVCVTDATGHSEHYQYNSANLLTQRTLKSGYPICFEWATQPGHAGNTPCLAQWGAPVAGQPTYHYTFEWAVGGNPLCNGATDSRGARWQYQFNAQGQCTQASNPLGAITRTQYDAHGHVVRITHPHGASEHWVRNAQGQVLQYTNVLGQVHRFDLNPQGLVLKHTLPEGQTHTYSYTDEGLLASHTDALGHTTRHRYNTQGLLCETTNPLGQSTRWLHNAQGQLQAQVDPLGGRTTYQFDAWGRLGSITNALGRSTHYAYNLAGQCTQVSNHEGQPQRFAYGPLGQMLRMVDATGRMVEYEYADGLSQPTARIDSLGQRLRYHYDGERNLVALTNENGEQCTFEYDLAEQLVRQTGFDGRVQAYVYNTAGHLVELQQLGTVGPGVSLPPQPLAWVHYQRDAAGQLLGLQASCGYSATYAYNAQGLLTQANNPHRALAWHYNPNGQVVAALQGEHTTTHTHNAAGWLKHTQWQAMGPGVPQGELALEYNALGLVQHMAINGQALAQFEYDALGRETVRRHGNRTQAQSIYDPQGRLVGQVLVGGAGQAGNAVGTGSSPATLARRRYRYNARNQLVRADDAKFGSTLYHYDILGRLQQVQGPTPEAFLFDPASNLLEHLEGEDASEALAKQHLPPPGSPNSRRPHQSAGNRLKRQGARRFAYDECGNRIEETFERGPRQGQTTRYHYNALNQLVQVVQHDGSATRYEYDALGRRIKKLHTKAGQTASKGFEEHTTFYWNGDVLLGEVHSNPRKASRSYVFEPFTFKPLAMVQHGQVLHYHTDHLGTPQELSNSEGRIVWQARFKAYGALALAGVSEVANPLRFQGQYFDEETGLHYNRHRYYDPQCGQFTTQDPIGLAGGLNAYQYAPNPVTWVDPWGLTCKEFLKTRTLIDGKVTEIDQQPLPKSVKDSFEGGQYRTVMTDEEIFLYRAYGGTAKASGGFATTLPAQNRIQAKQDLALLPEWKNARANEAVIKVPTGTVLNVGKVAPQTTVTGTLLKGGADQILLPQNWPSDWIINNYPIKP